MPDFTEDKYELFCLNYLTAILVLLINRDSETVVRDLQEDCRELIEQKVRLDEAGEFFKADASLVIAKAQQRIKIWRELKPKTTKGK